MSTEHNAEYYFGRALDKIDAHDTTGGLADLDQAIFLSPTNAKYYVERAKLLFLEVGRQPTKDDRNRIYQLHLEDLNKIIELGADLADLAYAHERKVYWFELSGRYQEQLVELDWLIDHDYANVTNYKLRAYCKSQLRQFDGAIKDYGTILEIDPDYMDAFFGRACVYYCIQVYQEALYDLNKVLTFEPQHPRYLSAIYSCRARTHYKLGKDHEAREDFIKSISLGGGNPLDVSAAEYMRILYPEE